MSVWRVQVPAVLCFDVEAPQNATDAEVRVQARAMLEKLSQDFGSTAIDPETLEELPEGRFYPRWADDQQEIPVEVVDGPMEEVEGWSTGWRRC